MLHLATTEGTRVNAELNPLPLNLQPLPPASLASVTASTQVSTFSYRFFRPINFRQGNQSEYVKSSSYTSQQIKKSVLLQPPAFPMVTLESLAAATSSAAAATVTTSVVSGGSHNEVTVTARNQSGRLQVLAASGTICHPTSSSSSPPALQGNAGLFLDWN